MVSAAQCLPAEFSITPCPATDYLTDTHLPRVKSGSDRKSKKEREREAEARHSVPITRELHLDSGGTILRIRLLSRILFFPHQRSLSFQSIRVENGKTKHLFSSPGAFVRMLVGFKDRARVQIRRAIFKLVRFAFIRYCWD